MRMKSFEEEETNRNGEKIIKVVQDLSPNVSEQ